MSKVGYLKPIGIVLIACVALMSMNGCSGTPFLGAQKLGDGNLYVERWYLKEEYDRRNIPEGTAFYGAAAQKIKDRFIVKYYIADGKRADVEIPPEDMWKVLHNGKRYNEQDDDDLYYYSIDALGAYKKRSVIHEGDLVAIQSCDAENWCLLYPSKDGIARYVKRSILYQGPTILNPVQKQKLALQKLYAEAQAKTATLPWVTPSEEACLNNYGKFEQYTRVKDYCIATLSAARKICQASDARLPTIEEFAQVIAECNEDNNSGRKQGGTDYQICYRQKGFYSSRYYSSTLTTTEREQSRPAWNRRELALLANFSSGSTDDISDPELKYSVICRSDEPS